MGQPWWAVKKAEGEWKLKDPRRNNRLIDPWTFVHVVAGAAATLVVDPVAAFLILAVYEPVEIFLISPLMWEIGIEFGYETWRNALVDVIFNGVGVLLGWYVILPRWNPFGV